MREATRQIRALRSDRTPQVNRFEYRITVPLDFLEVLDGLGVTNGELGAAQLLSYPVPFLLSIFQGEYDYHTPSNNPPIFTVVPRTETPLTGEIIVIKQAEGGVPDPASLDIAPIFPFVNVWIFEIDGPLGVGFYTLFPNASDQQNFPDLPPGDYTVEETFVDIFWEFVSITCDDPDVVIDVANRKADVTLAVGQTITCTVTNRITPDFSRLTVIKETDGLIPPGSHPFDFEITGPGGVGGPFQLALDDPFSDMNQWGPYIVPPGDYTLDVVGLPPGWTFDGPVECVVDDGFVTTLLSFDTPLISFDIFVGEAVVCTYYNLYEAPVDLPGPDDPAMPGPGDAPGAPDPGDAPGAPGPGDTPGGPGPGDTPGGGPTPEPDSSGTGITDPPTGLPATGSGGLTDSGGRAASDLLLVLAPLALLAVGGTTLARRRR